jgi:hypothetical protein
MLQAHALRNWSSHFKEVYLHSMDHSESWIDQISFEYATEGVIIFPFQTWKSAKGAFRIEHNQTVIIIFLWNEEIDTHEDAYGL